MTAGRRIGMLVVAMAACSPAPRSRPAASVAVPKPGTPPAPPPETPASARCERQGVSVEPPTLVADIACYPHCSPAGVEVSFRVVNCTPGPLVLTAFGYGKDLSFALMLVGDTSQRIEPGTSSEPYVMRARMPETGTALLGFSAPGSEKESVRVALPVRLTDSKSDEAAAACEAGGDYWGPRGRAGSPRCWKVMKDSGKPCYDMRDCEGACLLESETRVSATQKRVTGSCSRFRELSGCHARIGRTKGGLVPVAESFPRVCAD